ncbi:MAG: hypothetical protein PHX18_05965 [Candidatus Gastranaerophilales bacterium]|nr:hypothetical protein [Candidatus Gastranaerophilales bacterium]
MASNNVQNDLFLKLKQQGGVNPLQQGQDSSDKMVDIFSGENQASAGSANASLFGENPAVTNPNTPKVNGNDKTAAAQNPNQNIDIFSGENQAVSNNPNESIFANQQSQKSQGFNFSQIGDFLKQNINNIIPQSGIKTEDYAQGLGLELGASKQTQNTAAQGSPNVDNNNQASQGIQSSTQSNPFLKNTNVNNKASEQNFAEKLNNSQNVNPEQQAEETQKTPQQETETENLSFGQSLLKDSQNVEENMSFGQKLQADNKKSEEAKTASSGKENQSSTQYMNDAINRAKTSASASKGGKSGIENKNPGNVMSLNFINKSTNDVAQKYQDIETKDTSNLSKSERKEVSQNSLDESKVAEKDVKNEMNNVTTGIGKTEKQAQQTENNLYKTTRNLDDTKTAITDTKDEIEELEDDNDDGSNDAKIAKLEKKLSKLEDNKDQLEVNKKKLEKNKENCTEHVSSLNAQMNSLQQVLEKAQDVKSESQKQVDNTGFTTNFSNKTSKTTQSQSNNTQKTSNQDKQQTANQSQFSTFSAQLKNEELAKYSNKNMSAANNAINVDVDNEEEEE